MSCLSAGFIAIFTFCVGMSGLLLAESSIQITSPLAGEVVNPGQTIPVYVAPSGGPFSAISVYLPGMGNTGTTQTLTHPPYQFSFTAPMQISPGLQMIGALGFTATGPVPCNPVYVDIERTDSPQSISASDTQLELEVGHEVSINVIGKYSDGSFVNLTKSTLTKYLVIPSQIASITNLGVIMAVAPGSGRIVIRHLDREADVRLTVRPPRKPAKD